MIFELIKRRRAVFPDQFNVKPISKEKIEMILEAANWAPTHRKTEPWRFKIVQGNSRKKLGTFMSEKYLEIEARPKKFKARKMMEKPQQSAVVILICMQRDPEKRVPEWEEVAATAMAVQNMWLMCTELGIGSYWSSPALIEYMGEFVELQDGEKCLGLFYMGNYDTASSEAVRGPIKDKIIWLD